MKRVPKLASLITVATMLTCILSNASYARTIVVRLPEFSGPGIFTGPIELEVGTFLYSIPPGEEILDAKIEGTFGNSVTNSSAPNQVSLDSVLVAECTLDPGDTCTDFVSGITPWTFTFVPSDFDLLSDGAATLKSFQTSGVIVRLGETTLTIITDGPSELAVIENVEVNNRWRPVAIPQSFTDPVVIAGPPTFRNKQPGVVRLRTLAGGGVRARFQEWRYLDGKHPKEKLAMMVLRKGRHELSDGSIWEAGVLKLRGNRNWRRTKFIMPFEGRPEVFLTVQSFRDKAPVAVRARNVTTQSFEAALLEEERDLKTDHRAETVGYLAVYSRTRQGSIAVDLGNLSYELKNLAINQRLRRVLGERLKLEEERSKDKETRHKKEKVSAMTLGRAFFAQQITDKEPDTTAPRHR